MLDTMLLVAPICRMLGTAIAQELLSWKKMDSKFEFLVKNYSRSSVHTRTNVIAALVFHDF